MTEKVPKQDLIGVAVTDPFTAREGEITAIAGPFCHVSWMDGATEQRSVDTVKVL